MNRQNDLIRILRGFAALQADLATHLGQVETSPARVITVEKTLHTLTALNVSQKDLLIQAVQCIQFGVFRASIVLAWAGIVDYVQQRLAVDGFKQLNSVRPNWKITDTEDLRERFTEYAIIEAARYAGLYGKNMMKTLHGHLHTRNQAAHPSGYDPGLNEALGYLSDLLQHIRRVEARAYP